MKKSAPLLRNMVLRSGFTKLNIDGRENRWKDGNRFTLLLMSKKCRSTIARACAVIMTASGFSVGLDDGNYLGSRKSFFCTLGC